MIIAISGLTGSGKNTLGELLAKELKLPLICPTFKDLAKKEGITLMDFQKKAEKDSSIDEKFDEELKNQINATGYDCVVTTWLGPWVVDHDKRGGSPPGALCSGIPNPPVFRIYIFAHLADRIERVAKRDGISEEEAEKHIEQRDAQNRKRYKKVYDIDIYDTTDFDICINSGKFSKEKVKELALSAIKTKWR